LKIFILLFFIYTFLFARVYYSKVEPYEIRDITSNVLGKVLFTDENDIGKILSSKAYIRIDDELSRDELKSVNNKLKLLKQTIDLNKKILVNLKDELVKKDENYKKIEFLKIKSKVDKDNKLYDLLSTKNLILNTKKEIDNLQLQSWDLKFKKAQLQKDISDKSIRAKGFILYSISVKPGQVVTKLTPLAKVADISKAILTIYLDAKDVNGIKNRVIYIDGKKTAYRVSRILHIADSVNISRYMAQIIIRPPKLFSKLVKVELRYE